MRSRSAALRSGRGVYRNADGLIPTTVSACRSLNPRVTIARSTSRLTGAVTIFLEDLAGPFILEQRIRQQLL